MYSINFPQMISNNQTNLLEYKEAVKSDLLLLMSSERLSLFGDPYYGIALRKAIFMQEGSYIVDLLIDEIYTTIINFMPRIYVNRKDIHITGDGVKLYAKIKVTYLLDNTSDLYTIDLTAADDTK